MARDYMTDEEVELEIERLKNSEAVKLSLKEQRYKYRRRQQMYSLRWHEKHGRELMARGVTVEDFVEPLEDD